MAFMLLSPVRADREPHLTKVKGGSAAIRLPGPVAPPVPRNAQDPRQAGKACFRRGFACPQRGLPRAGVYKGSAVVKPSVLARAPAHVTAGEKTRQIPGETACIHRPHAVRTPSHSQGAHTDRSRVLVDSLRVRPLLPNRTQLRAEGRAKLFSCHLAAVS